MKRARVLVCILLVLITGTASAQRKKADADATVTDVVRPGGPVDTALVAKIFFSALREKTMENYTLAAEYFSRILKLDPSNDASMFELGKIRRSENNESSARDLFERATNIKPDNKYYWLALAESYEKNNDVVKLENVINQLIRIEPDNEEYLFDKANALFAEKKYDESLAVYKQIEGLTGLNDNIVANRQKIYLKQGKLDKATGEMEEMIKAYPEQIRYYLMLSELYNSNNLNDKALEVLKKAEKIKATNAMVHLAMADIYKDKKDYQSSFNQIKAAFFIPELNIDEKIRIIYGYFPKFPDPDAKASALELSRILTQVHPADAKAYGVYGNMLMQNSEFKAAKPVLKKAIEINSQIYEVWEQLIRLELSDGEAGEAVKDGENALSYFPNQAWLNYLVGVAWLQKKDYKKAISYAENVPSLETQDKTLLSQNYSLIGDSYHNLKDNKNSDGAYDKALTYDPDNAYTLNNFAYYLSVRGEQLDKAATMVKHAIEKQPNTASFEDTYAWILFKQKKFPEARTWIEKALIDDKSKSAVQIEHYGDIMFYLGDTEAAVENWKKAKQFGDQSTILDRKINEKKYVE